MGIQPSEFWKMTIAEVLNALIRFNDTKTLNFRNTWNQVRMQSFWAAAANLKKGTTIERFMPFDWDKGTVSKDISEYKPILADVFPKDLKDAITSTNKE